ncbi:MAG: hypothetical protein ABIA93_06915 [Candidatus Woesearchaeota archaeon]
MDSKTYDTIAVMFNLPSYASMDVDFDLGCIEDDTAKPLHEVMRRVVERIDYVLKVLDEILNPETNLTTVHEANVFTERERSALYIVYRHMMTLFRKSQIADISGDDVKRAAFINEAVKVYSELKPALLDALGKLQQAWAVEEGKQNEPGYFG